MAAVPFEGERKLKAALEWLKAELADGQPHLAGGLLITGAELGHAERTLQRASSLLKVQRQPTYSTRGAIEGWLWTLDAHTPQPG
ncbi:MAG TPA: hypothetical protein VH599_22215 [Ktedonobacterales bacterium]|jgi:hypothetical protein